MSQSEFHTSPVLGDLVAKVKAGECILFLGASVHAPPPKDSDYKYPQEQRPLMSGELAWRLADGCGYAREFPRECGAVLDLKRVALCYETDMGRDRLVDFLTQHLRAGKEPSPALKMLAKLPFKIFVTTNYDRLLEDALTERPLRKDPEVLVYDPEFGHPSPDITGDPSIERPLVFKMHGDLDQRNREAIVITDEDYITFIQRMTEKFECHPVPPTVRFRMLKWSTLFVGYSLRDYNLRLLFKTLRWRLDESNFPRSFSVDIEPDRLIVHWWEHKRGIVRFVSEDLWSFVPSLFEGVYGEKYSDWLRARQ